MPNHQTANTKNCAILIAAYKAEKWIMNCIDGFKKQIPLEGWNYNIVIGIDGCKNTAKVLDDNKISYYWSKENVGLFIMLNSLWKKTEADVYMHFDADDVPLPNLLKTSIPIVWEFGFVRAKEIRCDENLNPLKKQPTKDGKTLITKKAMQDLGGWQHFRTACDTDIRNRAKKLGYNVKLAQSFLTEPLLYRRRHNQSLTKSPKTNMKSDYRIWAREEMKKFRESGKLKVNPIITELEWRN